MNLIIFSIIVFSIISIATNNTAKTQRGKMTGRRTPWDQPWKPPVSTPRKVSTGERGVGIPAWLEATFADPDKEQELSSAGGREGEWGDEGRSGTYLNKVEPEGKEGYTSEGLPGTEGSEERSVISNEYEGNKQVREPQTTDFGLAFSENSLVQGVVWAEILNSPRALRRYRGPRG